MKRIPPPSNPKENWEKALRRILPANRLKTDMATREAYAGDAWFARHLPDAVAFPQSTKEVAALMKVAARYRVPVTARGAGRGYVGGCVPERGGIVVSLEKMRRILELNTADGVAVAQPCVITGDLQRKARAKGWCYPPDPASLDECSLGGNVATNAGGPRCLKYGVTRSYILGLEVVLADGSIVRVGGRTHKNKTGFDLVGLFVGSEGLLGIVTEITVRLIPHPATRACVSATFATATEAAAAVNAVFAAGLLPAAMEVADAFTLSAARQRLGVGLVPEGSAHLLVEVDGSHGAVAADVEAVEAIVKKAGGLHLRRAEGDAGCEELWKLRREFSASLKATGLTKLNEDIAVPRGRLVDIFAWAERMQKKFKMPIACFGHAGDGNIHVNIMADPQRPGEKLRMQKALDELFSQVTRWGGVITGEHGVGLAKKRWWQRHVSREVREVHRLIKGTLDPLGILNPDKFV
jgi:glycolate oxidase